MVMVLQIQHKKETKIITLVILKIKTFNSENHQTFK